MSNAFDNSRCNEILEAAIAREGGRKAIQKSRKLPLEAKVMSILAFKSLIVCFTPKETHSFLFSELNKMIEALFPEIASDEVHAVYARMTRLLVSDITDLKNGKL